MALLLKIYGKYNLSNDLTNTFVDLIPNISKIWAYKKYTVRAVQVNCNFINILSYVLSALKTPPAYFEQCKQLERAKTGDLLKAKIQRRPDRQELERRHILEQVHYHLSVLWCAFLNLSQASGTYVSFWAICKSRASTPRNARYFSIVAVHHIDSIVTSKNDYTTNYLLQVLVLFIVDHCHRLKN